MNPFEDYDTNNTESKDITIWVETNGCKKNTYISGWNISDSQIKEHLKTIKKKMDVMAVLNHYLIKQILDL